MENSTQEVERQLAEVMAEVEVLRRLVQATFLLLAANVSVHVAALMIG